MNKLIKDGKVAVLYSPGFGAGWHSWGAPIEAVFDPDLANAVLEGDKEKALQIAKAKWPSQYHGGVKDLTVEWLPVGAQFRIDEYDGYESVEVLGQIDFITA